MITQVESVSQQEARNRAYLYWGLVSVAIIIGIYHTSSLWYINDDCFVSFRYAKNLVEGHGLVYNIGERVEGYTNFLWTIIIALGLQFGLDPVPFSTTLGIAFSLLTLLLYGYLGWRLRPGDSKMIFIPLTAIALSIHRDFNAHASSGMETSLFSFLISVTYALLLFGKTRMPILSAGFVLTLAMMTRPDGVIFLAVSAVYILITKKDWLHNGFLLMAAPFLLFLPYWLWRWSYFGFFFPNTFYAKSVNLSYWSQGFEYAKLYFTTYYGFAMLFILLAIASIKLMTVQRESKTQLFLLKTIFLKNNEPRPVLLAALFIVSYSLFVIKIGGDFMFARFFIAITPMIFFSMEFLLVKHLTQPFRSVLWAIILITTLFRYDHYKENVFSGYVADEFQYFGDESYLVAQRQAGTLRKCFGDLPVRVAFGAGQLMLVYYLDPPYALEASGGLTDTAIAHQSIGERGRPGHEKTPGVSYLMNRGIEFYIGYVEPPKPGELTLNVILFDTLLARTIIYNDAIMKELAQKPEVKFVNIPLYLDWYIGKMADLDKNAVAADFAYFKRFYFDHNEDLERENAFIEFLNSP